MARDPSVTVLMTVFNAGRFLDPSIRSIVNQKFRDWEFVIVDDASTDGSLDVVEKWLRMDPRIRLVRNETNKGQTPCLNQGLALAKGKWTARQDADDLSHPLRLTKQFERVTIEPELALLGTAGRILDENDKLTGLLDVPLESDDIKWLAPILNPFLHTSVLFRTDLIRDELGGYDESFRIAQDYDLWLRIISEYPSANLEDRLVAYRHLGSSLSKAGRNRAFDEARVVAQRFAPELPETAHDLFATFRQGLNVEKQKEFWFLIGSMAPKKKASGHRRTIATLHLKAAGALPKTRAVSEMLCALLTDPMITLRWLKERYL